ncbi:hypothetical protein J4Q44_G00227740 [Coregonus suidteri]|uniref:Uncharacterized protein n=1 Tax=Coregonus suidteri TaxID=861788 RepID=A0AAN8QPZ9_9TELE
MYVSERCFCLVDNMTEWRRLLFLPHRFCTSRAIDGCTTAQEDMQMHSNFLDRKEELKAAHASSLRQHPDLCTMMADFLQFLLLRKLSDVIFACKDFSPFASHRTLGGGALQDLFTLRKHTVAVSQ